VSRLWLLAALAFGVLLCLADMALDWAVAGAIRLTRRGGDGS
jgi:hypothetical protein